MDTSFPFHPDSTETRQNEGNFGLTLSWMCLRFSNHHFLCFLPRRNLDNVKIGFFFFVVGFSFPLFLRLPPPVRVPVTRIPLAHSSPIKRSGEGGGESRKVCVGKEQRGNVEKRRQKEGERAGGGLGGKSVMKEREQG